jgi:DNA invertase Pin-like site-specific DNA recombinase
MNAVIYARYSSDNQREESIEGQIRECTAFAEKNGITILRHYIDRAYSAKTDNRPEFQNMIKDSGKKLFDMIIVWKLDRFARNRYDSARYKALLKKNGVKVMSATEVISEGAEGIILESVLEGYAEYYSADLSEKVVRGMTENVLKGKYNGGSLTIGYQLDSERHILIDPLTAPVCIGGVPAIRAGRDNGQHPALAQRTRCAQQGQGTDLQQRPANAEQRSLYRRIPISGHGRAGRYAGGRSARPV